MKNINLKKYLGNINLIGSADHNSFDSNSDWSLISRGNSDGSLISRGNSDGSYSSIDDGFLLNRNNSEGSFVIIGDEEEEVVNQDLPENIKEFYKQIDKLEGKKIDFNIDYENDILESVMNNINANPDFFNRKINIVEKNTPSIDFGGPTRMFFTKFSEYLISEEIIERKINLKGSDKGERSKLKLKDIMEEYEEKGLNYQPTSKDMIEDYQEKCTSSQITSKDGQDDNKNLNLKPRYFIESSNGYFRLHNYYDENNFPKYQLIDYFNIGRMFAYAIKSKNIINIPLNPLLLHLLLSKEIVESSDENSNFLDLVDILGEYPIKEHFINIYNLVKSEDLTLKFHNINNLDEVIKIFNYYDEEILTSPPYLIYNNLRNISQDSQKKDDDYIIGKNIKDIEDKLNNLNKEMAQTSDREIIIRKMNERKELQSQLNNLKKQQLEKQELEDLKETNQESKKFDFKSEIFNKSFDVPFESKDKFVLYMIKYHSFLINYKETMEFIRGFHSIISPEHLKILDIKTLDYLIAGEKKIDLNYFLDNLSIQEIQIEGEQALLTDDKKKFIIDIITREAGEHSDYLNYLLYLFTGSKRLGPKGFKKKFRIVFDKIFNKESATHTCDDHIYIEMRKEFLTDDDKIEYYMEKRTSNEKLEIFFSYKNIMELGNIKSNYVGGSV